jgi:hypothetical protein
VARSWAWEQLQARVRECVWAHCLLCPWLPSSLPTGGPSVLLKLRVTSSLTPVSTRSQWDSSVIQGQINNSCHLLWLCAQTVLQFFIAVFSCALNCITVFGFVPKLYYSFQLCTKLYYSFQLFTKLYYSFCFCTKLYYSFQLCTQIVLQFSVVRQTVLQFLVVRPNCITVFGCAPKLYYSFQLCTKTVLQFSVVQNFFQCWLIVCVNCKHLPGYVPHLTSILHVHLHGALCIWFQGCKEQVIVVVQDKQCVWPIQATLPPWHVSSDVTERGIALPGPTVMGGHGGCNGLPAHPACMCICACAVCQSQACGQAGNNELYLREGLALVAKVGATFAEAN